MKSMPSVVTTTAVATMISLTGCDSFVQVTNPNVVEAGAINPDTDGPLLAWSAYQDFVSGFGDIILNTAWFTTDAWTGDSSEDRSQIGRREIDPANGRMGRMWANFARGLATSERAIEVLQGTTNASSNIHLARVSLSSGYSYLLMAETFCRGAVLGGPPLDQAQMLSLAEERLTAARSIAQGAGGADGDAIATAAAVGLGRTYLLADRPADAANAVSSVPADFNYYLYTADDPANRERLGNRFWEATADRAALVVAPRHRDLADDGDPRVGYRDTGVAAYDGLLHMYAQTKYDSWDAPYRLASGLEAEYIAIEARGSEAEMLAWVNARRMAGGHDTVSLAGNELLSEFLRQKSLDLWLEGQRMGDFQRHGASLPDLIPTGSELYKPAAGPVGDDTCFPLPISETSANVNF